MVQRVSCFGKSLLGLANPLKGGNMRGTQIADAVVAACEKLLMVALNKPGEGFHTKFTLNSNFGDKVDFIIQARARNDKIINGKKCSGEG